MGKIHLVARRSDQHASNFYRLRDGVYLSGWWAFSDDAAQRLVEGSIFLHETKNVASRYGGRILGYRHGPVGTADEGRIGIEFEFAESSRGVAWDWGDNAANARAEMSICL
jgi:hypothetical protein